MDSEGNNHRDGTVRLGSIGSIPVTLHMNFFMLLGIELLSGIRHGTYGFFAFIFLLYGPILLVTVLLVSLAACVCGLVLIFGLLHGLSYLLLRPF